MRLSKKDDPARKWRSFVRHLLFMLQPLIIAAAVTGIWYALWKRGVHFSDRDEVILTSAIIAVLGIAFSIIAGVTLTAILDKYRQVVRSVIERDERTFLLWRDERLPIILNLMLGALSLFLVGMVMLINYHDMRFGICAVFAVTYSITLYFIVATELQNPAKSPWFVERIPSEWLAVDVDEHFRLEAENENKK